ncbi:hypothetical protein Nepgr_033520 [Nepenthes gracilis]|uniref:Uncharacterized protein n=1 Tax=Nepenthes gracilis TaxID=150966 RepID=A0AAD3TM31_NEPGR|nr:hypothetical protein Nepgr_033520 [Nepenthes gracilis]
MPSKIVEVKVVYHWKPARPAKGSNANQSCSDRISNGLKVKQIAKPENQAPGAERDRRGSSSLDSLSVVHISLGVKPRHEIDHSCPYSASDDTESAVVYQEDPVCEHLGPESGKSGALDEASSIQDLLVSVQEFSCRGPDEIQTSGNWSWLTVSPS